MFTPISLAITAGVCTAILGITAWCWSRLERSEPNQWLLRIRNGKAVEAGIGIQIWRRPGDTFARFTSTMQRVTFDAEILTEDKQQLQIKGFLLWVVSAEESAPFRAFSRLGIAHREASAPHDPEQHHALRRAQHHAFRRSVEAAVRKAAVAFSLRDLLGTPEQLTHKVQEDMAQMVASWGISLETMELTDLVVVQQELFGHMQAPYIAQSRREATELQLASEAQIAQMRLEQERDTARRRAEMARQSERELAQIALEQAKESAAMASEQAAVQEQQLLQDLAATEAEAAARHEQALQDLARQQALREAELHQARHLQTLREQQRDLEADAQLQRQVREKTAEREHIEANLAIERNKPEAIREAEQARHIVSAAADALGHLPLQEVRWISSDNQGPTGIMLGLIDALQQVATTHTPKKTPSHTTQ